jgi:hypothetical protein
VDGDRFTLLSTATHGLLATDTFPNIFVSLTFDINFSSHSWTTFSMVYELWKLKSAIGGHVVGYRSSFQKMEVSISTEDINFNLSPSEKSDVIKNVCQWMALPLRLNRDKLQHRHAGMHSKLSSNHGLLKYPYSCKCLGDMCWIVNKSHFVFKFYI